MAASQPSQLSQTSTGKFIVPNITDDEDDSEDLFSIDGIDGHSMSEHEHELSSSPKTSPERPKTSLEQGGAKLGSQQKPIDIDTDVGVKPLRNIDAEWKSLRNIIDLDDDDEQDHELHARHSLASGSSTASTSQQPLVEDSIKVIPETIPETINERPASPQPMTAFKGIPLVRPTREHSGHSEESDYGSEVNEDWEDHDDDFEGIDRNAFENASSELEMSVVSDGPLDAEDHDEDAAVETYGNQYRYLVSDHHDSNGRSSLERLEPYDFPPHSHSDTQFSNSPLHNYSPRNNDPSTYISSEGWPYPDSRSYGRGYQTTTGAENTTHSYNFNPRTGYLGLGQARRNASPFNPTIPADGTDFQPNVFGPRFVEPPTFNPTTYYPLSAASHSSIPLAPSQPVWSSAQTSHDNHIPQALEPRSSIVKNKSNIFDVLEATSMDATDDLEAVSTPAKKETSGHVKLSNLLATVNANAFAAAERTSAVTSDKKRKAETMLAPSPTSSNSESVASNVSVVVNPSESVADSTENVGPPSKKRKILSTAAKTGGAVGGVAAVFAAGGAAAMAFLCSPLAERAIEWLA